MVCVQQYRLNRPFTSLYVYECHMLIAYSDAYDGLYKLGNGTYIYTFRGLVGLFH